MREVEAVGSSSAFGRLLGLEIVKAENGEAVLRLEMHDGLRNLHGKLHGGALFSLIDTGPGEPQPQRRRAQQRHPGMQGQLHSPGDRRRADLSRLGGARRPAHSGARSRSPSRRETGRQGAGDLLGLVRHCAAAEGSLETPCSSAGSNADGLL